MRRWKTNRLVFDVYVWGCSVIAIIYMFISHMQYLIIRALWPRLTSVLLCTPRNALLRMVLTSERRRRCVHIFYFIIYCSCPWSLLYSALVSVRECVHAVHSEKNVKIKNSLGKRRRLVFKDLFFSIKQKMRKALHARLGDVKLECKSCVRESMLNSAPRSHSPASLREPFPSFRIYLPLHTR